jgi:8-oxo-dGTP diphosphatase
MRRARCVPDRPVNTGNSRSLPSGVITDDHGHTLLIQRRDNHYWEPPGGVLELAESIGDGLRREVREETGLDIEPGTLSGVYKNMNRGIIALVFRCKVTGGQLTTNDEVTAFRWADEDTIRQLVSDAFAVRLLDALSNSAAPAIRQHDGTNLLWRRSAALTPLCQSLGGNRPERVNDQEV